MSIKEVKVKVWKININFLWVSGLRRQRKFSVKRSFQNLGKLTNFGGEMPKKRSDKIS